MCYEKGELPPFPPIRGGADAFGDITLTASDGAEFSAYYAHPAISSDRAVVILPDIGGLGEFYKDLTLRFAEAGVHAVAIDYYTREMGRGDRPLEQRDAIAAYNATNKEVVDLDVAAALNWLHERPGLSLRSVFVVGFCWGGTLSWHQSATSASFAGYVAFYGVAGFVSEARVPNMRGPMLMLIAGQDREPVEVVEGLADRIRSSGAIVETHVYERAPHSFFSRSGEFEPECVDAWDRVLDFLDRYAQH